MWKILAYIQKNLIWTLPVVMVLGLFTGQLFEMKFIKIFILPLTFLMVYPMMVNMPLDQVLNLKGLKVQWVTQLINFGVIPFFALAVGRYFFEESPMLMLGMLLAGLLPTSGMTISWTGFAYGNMNAAVKMTVFGLILGSLLTPVYVQWLLGAVVEVPLAQVFQQIFLVVFLPLILGNLTRRLLFAKIGKEQYIKNYKMKFPLISNLGVLGIVFVAMALKSRDIVAKPETILQMLIPLLLLYVGNFLFSTLIAKWWFNREDGIALVFGSVLRNLSIALAIAMSAFGEAGAEVGVVIAFAYIVQVQLAAWYAKGTNLIFGAPNV